MTAKAENLSKQAVKGTLWTYLSFVSGKFLTFLTTLILARLLTPEQFGVMGYCLTVTYFLDTFNTFGVGTALISRSEKVQEAANAAFWISMASSIGIVTLGWVSAPAIASFFNEPLVAELLRVLVLSQLISAVAAVPNALVQRNLKFGARMIPELGKTIVKGLVSIALALNGYGVWSLVWGQVAGELLSTIALWFIAPWRPTWLFDRQTTRDMLVLGSHLVAVTLVGIVLMTIDNLIVGRVLGSAALGYYLLAYRVPDLIIRNFNVVTARVAHPVLARLQSDLGRMGQFFLKYIHYMSLLTFPAGVGIALLSEPFIRVFYGATWQPAVVAMQAISIALAIQSPAFIPGVLYKAVNRPALINKLALIRIPFVGAILWYATAWGFNGVAIGQVVVAVLTLLMECVFAARIVRVSLREIGAAMAPAAAGCVVMAAAIESVKLLLPVEGVVALVVLGLVGALSFAGTIALVSRDTATRATNMVRSMLVRL